MGIPLSCYQQRQVEQEETSTNTVNRLPAGQQRNLDASTNTELSLNLDASTNTEWSFEHLGRSSKSNIEDRFEELESRLDGTEWECHNLTLKLKENEDNHNSIIKSYEELIRMLKESTRKEKHDLNVEIVRLRNQLREQEQSESENNDSDSEHHARV
ncbi:MAG: hypothetical protein ABW185_03795 [Sedimenticola sp.]